MSGPVPLGVAPDVAAQDIRASFGRRATRPALQVAAEAFRDRRGRLVLLGSVSLASGLAEAATMGLLVSVVGALRSANSGLAFQLPLLGVSTVFSPQLLFAVCLCAIAVRAGLQTIEAWAQARIVTSYEAEMRRRLFGAFADASWKVQAKESLGRVQAVLSEAIAQGRGALKGVTEGIVAAANFVVLAIAALLVDPLAVLVLAAIAGPLFALARPLARQGKRLALKKAGLNIDFNSAVNEGVVMAQEIRVFRASERIKANVGAIVGAVRRNRLRSEFLTSMVSVAYQGSTLLVIVGGLAAAWALGASDLTRLAVVALLLVRALTYSQSFQSHLHNVVERTAFLEQLQDVERDYDRPVEKPGRAAVDRIDSLTLQRVSFAYENGRDVLQDVSAVVPKGACVGVIGPSGAGKSTLIQLLLRLREPTGGLLMVNGSGVEQFSLESWYRLVSYVPQEPRLLNTSLLENIRFFRENITDGEVEAAAHQAGIHDEIVALPAGYRTSAGERGGALSGGQRQRVCIARALAGRPDVLIFDEPTSALDVHSEERIFEALTQLKGRVTLFIIAHRLSTLAMCDRLMVIREGRLQAYGPPAELAKTDAYYAEALKKSQLG